MPHEVPKDISDVEKGWFFFQSFWLGTHYVVGVVGVIAGVLAAGALSRTLGDSSQLQEISGLVGAVCSAILGFLKPDKLHRKYVVVYGMINTAITQYANVDGDMAALVKVKADCFKLLTQEPSGQ